jgi:rhodanese-related sulfurtransferase
MKLKNILLATALLSSSLLASEFIPYKQFAKELIAQEKKAGNYASLQEVKDALKAKDWAVVDVRTIEEWSAASIEGSYRVGRQSPEKALENIALDDNDKFVKDKLIVICNSAARASIEAQTFRKMGFKEVKVYSMYTWIDKCNPVVTGYSKKKDKEGTKKKFGMFKAEHCSK